MKAKAMRGVKKQHLPQKICLVCQRPFTWRKKWERNWDEVKYCSKACRNQRQKSTHDKEKAQYDQSI
jgi:hypothetical protein